VNLKAMRVEDVLSESDLDTLYRARDLRERFEAGIFAATIGDVSHFRKLERHGLLAFDGWGRDIDRVRESDVMIYQLTAKANRVLAARDAYREALAS
jgi:hypothetical protein